MFNKVNIVPKRNTNQCNFHNAFRSLAHSYRNSYVLATMQAIQAYVVRFKTSCQLCGYEKISMLCHMLFPSLPPSVVVSLLKYAFGIRPKLLCDSMMKMRGGNCTRSYCWRIQIHIPHCGEKQLKTCICRTSCQKAIYCFPGGNPSHIYSWASGWGGPFIRDASSHTKFSSNGVKGVAM